jgi:hypothetical protein
VVIKKLLCREAGFESNFVVKGETEKGYSEMVGNMQ